MSQLPRRDRLPSVPALLRRLNAQHVARLRAAYESVGLEGLRPAHLAVLLPLRGGGSRAADLAVSAGVSRQAVAQVLTVLEQGGYVRRVRDPTDARARLVEITEEGRRALRVTRQVAVASEQRWRVLLGDRRLTEFTQVLAILVEDAEADASREIDDGS